MRKKTSRNKRRSISWAARLDNKYVRLMNGRLMNGHRVVNYVAHARAVSHHGYGALELKFLERWWNLSASTFLINVSLKIRWNQKDMVEVCKDSELVMLRLKQELLSPWEKAGKRSPELERKIKYYETKEGK